MSKFDWDEKGCKQLFKFLKKREEEDHIGCITSAEIDIDIAISALVRILNSSNEEKWFASTYKVYNNRVILLRDHIVLDFLPREKVDMFMLGKKSPVLIDFTRERNLFKKMSSELKTQLKKDFRNGLKL